MFDPGQGADVAAVRAHLVAVSRKVNDALAACGFPHCKGGVMAGNPWSSAARPGLRCASGLAPVRSLLVPDLEAAGLPTKREVGEE